MAHRANSWSLVLIMACLTGCNDDPATPTTAAPPAAAHAGVLETAHDSQISGWAWQTDRPDEPVEVELLDGQTQLTIVKADGFRQDLVDAKIGNGKHTFQVATPESLKDGKPHEIHARIVGTSFELRDSPKQYQFQGAQNTTAQ